MNAKLDSDGGSALERLKERMSDIALKKVMLKHFPKWLDEQVGTGNLSADAAAGMRARMGEEKKGHH